MLAVFDTGISRAEWRVVLSFHLAETKEEAIADLRHSFPKRAYVGDSRVPGRGLALGAVNGRVIRNA